jgi:hypothetical protein
MLSSIILTTPSAPSVPEAEVVVGMVGAYIVPFGGRGRGGGHADQWLSAHSAFDRGAHNHATRDHRTRAATCVDRTVSYQRALSTRPRRRDKTQEQLQARAAALPVRFNRPLAAGYITRSAGAPPRRGELALVTGSLVITVRRSLSHIPNGLGTRSSAAAAAVAAAAAAAHLPIRTTYRPRRAPTQEPTHSTSASR